ncbi:hypothetical protein QFC20_005972 [Naganishia adeliensis]|uniref:Uncharacterized protein n=1 Tax=Naganishia adeliensis TaxID=92952 RepID=A0ACC2VGP9_9TREE|nr:hypothetical protein QFC20_005972 [Naganishia adeliensis]
MAALFAPNLNQSRAETQILKPNKLFSAISKFGKTLKLGSNIGSRRSSQQEDHPHTTSIDASASVINNLNASSRNRLSRIISKQLSMETTSSYATTMPSMISSSPTSARMHIGTPEETNCMQRPLALIPSIESLLDISATSAQPANGNVGTMHDVMGASVCRISSSDSFGQLFSSESSSPMLAESSSATTGNELALVLRTAKAARPVNLVIPAAVTPPHECTVHGAVDSSSVEVSYQSVPSGPSTADTLVQQSATSGPSTGDTFYKSTFEELEADELSPSESGLAISRPSSALSESAAPDAEDAEGSKPIIDWDNPQSWTKCFDESSSSSLSDVASSDDAQSIAVVDEPEYPSPSSTPSSSIDSEFVPDACLQVLSPDSHICCSQQLESFGKVGAFLMTYVYLPFIPPNSTYAFLPAQGLSEPWPVRILTDIMEEDESEDAADAQKSTDASDDCLPVAPVSTSAGSATAASLFLIAEDEELEETFYNKESEAAESGSDNEQHLAASTSRNPYVARVLQNATPFQRNTRAGIAWEDLQSIPTIMEEEAEPSGNVLRASASHDSLLAADSDEFEYSQYCLPSESSAASELSDVHAASLPPRPISRWCMREDFVESDEE